MPKPHSFGTLWAYDSRMGRLTNQPDLRAIPIVSVHPARSDVDRLVTFDPAGKKAGARTGAALRPAHTTGVAPPSMLIAVPVVNPA